MCGPLRGSHEVFRTRDSQEVTKEYVAPRDANFEVDPHFMIVK